MLGENDEVTETHLVVWRIIEIAVREVATKKLSSAEKTMKPGVKTKSEMKSKIKKSAKPKQKTKPKSKTKKNRKSKKL